MGHIKKRWLYSLILRLRVFLTVNFKRSLDAGSHSLMTIDFKRLVSSLVSIPVGIVRWTARILVVLAMLLWGLCQGIVTPFKDRIIPLLGKMNPTLEYLHGQALQIKFGKRGRLMPVVLLLTATISIFSASYFGIGIEVFLDGQSVGFAGTKSDVTAIIHQVELETSKYLERPYNINADIKYSLGYIQRDNMLKEDKFKEKLSSQINEVSVRYVLLLDGKIIGANNSKTDLELLKNRIMNERMPEHDGVTSSFVQELTIEEKLISNAYVKPVAQIEAELRGSTRNLEEYTVKEGESIEEIAQTFGVTASALRTLNPGMEDVVANTNIKVAASAPLLSVKSIKVDTYSETIPYDVKVEYSDTLYKNQSKVARKGTNGTASIVANVVFIDGVESQREIVDYSIVTDPVNEVKLVGTKALPAKAATGSFVWPFRGIITSRYGYRFGGSEFHGALDIAGASGSPIVAADGGTVIMSKRNGNLGLCIIIDHGNGLQTTYAHCSQLLVKQGQKVAKGERIARVGSTGRSSGPHLHFEVRKNGNIVNPNNYLK